MVYSPRELDMYLHGFGGGGLSLGINNNKVCGMQAAFSLQDVHRKVMYIHWFVVAPDSVKKKSFL